MHNVVIGVVFVVLMLAAIWRVARGVRVFFGMVSTARRSLSTALALTTSLVALVLAIHADLNELARWWIVVCTVVAVGGLFAAFVFAELFAHRESRGGKG